MIKKNRSEIFLSPEQRLQRSSIPATEAIPYHLKQWSANDILFETKHNSPPTIHTEIEKLGENMHGTQWRINIKHIDENIRNLKSGQQKGFIGIEELANFSNKGNLNHKSFIPPWVTLTYSPQIIPRYKKISKVNAINKFFIKSGLSTLFTAELFSLNDYPYCTIGKVFTSLGKGGSGVLVGPNLMLTASHVVPWEQNEWWMEFIPAYRDFKGPFGSSYVRQLYGVRYPNDHSDFVICELFQPLGNICGWMGSWGSTDDDFYEDRQWDSVGYPMDFFAGERPAVEFGISPQDADVDGDEVQITFSSPFAAEGWSGGPLFGWVDDQPRVVGIMKGMEHNDYWILGSDDDSLFTGGIPMVNLIQYGLTNWPL